MKPDTALCFFSGRPVKPCGMRVCVFACLRLGSPGESANGSLTAPAGKKDQVVSPTAETLRGPFRISLISDLANGDTDESGKELAWAAAHSVN